MPGGRGGGRGRGRGRGRRQGVMNFLRPCLLFLLCRGEGHGYSLLDGLAEFGFGRGIDPSLVYRALREMEEAGWIASRLGEESQGPQRRVYRILPAGEQHLADWIDNLRRTRDEIDHLVQAYEREIGSR
jgi:PadR family transcriptional regulator PadR